MTDTALLIIDLQADYFPGGKMVLDGADAAVAGETVPSKQVHAAFIPSLRE